MNVKKLHINLRLTVITSWKYNKIDPVCWNS